VSITREIPGIPDEAKAAIRQTADLLDKIEKAALSYVTSTGGASAYVAHYAQTEAFTLRLMIGDRTLEKSVTPAPPATGEAQS
jgi:HD superfamily phosphodiesterase